jgi:uncharacterized protein (TIGR03083 family)
MARMDVWPVVHAERQALAADLDRLSADQWSTPSMCAGWSVEDALAHMTATTRMSPGKFFGQLVTSGGSFEKVQRRGIDAAKGPSGAQTLAGFRSELQSLKHPPGPVDTMLGETIVHAEDIRRPLGIKREYPADAVVAVADFFKKSNLILHTKRRIAGLTLRATDVDWSHGTGPEVSGPMLPLLLAMTGRKGALDELSGPGVETLRGRP